MYIFAYGSLIWNPNFKYLSKKEFILEGYERDFCIETAYHRGCEKQKGLVLAIRENKISSCKGILFKVEEENYKKIKEYLYKREMQENSYIPKIFKVNLNNKEIEFLTFIANENSSLYKKDLCIKEKAKIIKTAKGLSGTNIDYYNNTLNSLKDIGVDYEPIFKINQYFY